MAQPTTEMNNLRKTVTELLNVSIPKMAAAVALIDGAGDNDTDRAAFFALAIAGEGNTDITATEFNDGALALRAVQTAFTTNLADLYKLRK